jgi:hypothetical protein
MSQSANDSFNSFRYQYPQFLSEKLRELLETKHLYQRLSVSPDDLFATLKERVWSASDEKNKFQVLVSQFLTYRFIITAKQQVDQYQNPTSCLIVGNTKLFCSKCGQREAFRPIGFSDITETLLTRDAGEQKFKVAFGNTFQLFYIVFQCQHCEDKPEVFLIKRDKLDLYIEGRSPIEHVEIPSYISKDERHWFRDAVIAFQTGKILAALFYLRTFIEQFARGKKNLKDEKKTGEEIMAAYAKLLPAHLRDSMPSLAEWYDKLSEALHGAKEDAKLFETARERIEKHFDIRRVHDLDAKA